MAKLDVGHLGTGSLGSLNVGSLSSVGEYIRDQRRSAQYSLRQLADAAGVSNPYLSQIERGLRKPSAEILQQIAKALRISAETLYVRAGILEERDGDHEVTAAVLADPVLTDRQKRVLLDIYASFVRENAVEQPKQAAGSADSTESIRSTEATTSTESDEPSETRAKPRAAAADAPRTRATTSRPRRSTTSRPRRTDASSS
ncbi:MAG: helix-turn-helix domain-containing protein [Motilibacteraceae bacterium]